MDATLEDVTKSKPEPTAEQEAAEELVRRAREQDLSLTGPDGLLKQLTKMVIEIALNQEMNERLGHEKHTHPDDPEFHAHLARNAPAAGHREIPEIRRQLEIAPAGIPGKTLLQQRLQLPAQICADLGFRDTQYRDGLAVRARLAHTLESSAVPGDLLREPA
jgi:hypothetical protein